MKNIISLIKKYKLYILSVLLVFFFFRSCQKSNEIRKLGKMLNLEPNWNVVDLEYINLNKG